MTKAVIIARGGSKRIPRKNIKPFLGKPMLQRTIEKAEESKLFKTIYVSTEDTEIIELARTCGATILSRGEKLSDDFSTTGEVMASVAHQLIDEGAHEDEILVCIYPVTPLLNFEWIAKGISLYNQTESNFVFTAQQHSSPIERSFRVGENNKLLPSNQNFQNARTQDLPNSFHDSGQFYLGSMKCWSLQLPIFTEKSTILELPKYEVLDIDDDLDWNHSEEIFKIRGFE